MSHINPSWTKRLLSLAVVLALLLAYLPAGLIVNATEGSLIPDTVSRVVYVAGEGATLPEGVTSYTSLETAMQELSEADANASAVIVIAGTVTSTVTWNTDGAVSHKGTYYITGKYGDFTGGTLKFQKTGNSTTNYNFGGPVVIENLTITQERNKNLNIHTSTSLIIGENVTTGGAGVAKICLIGGSYHEDVDNTEIKISSGNWATVRAGNNTKNITGTATITIGGSATVTDLYASGNAADIDVANVVMNINAGTVTNLYYSGSLAGSTNGDVTVNLNAGTVTNVAKGAGTINGNLTVNVGEEYDLSKTTFAVKDTLAEGKTSTLNLGEVSAEPAASLTEQFDTVNYTLPIPESASQVYVKGDAEAGGDGSEDAPFQTLTDAYAHIATNSPNEGGIITLCGNVTIDANTNFESYGITGLVTLTSSDNAVLKVSGGSSTDVSLYFGHNTKIENFSIDSSDSKSLFLFTGAEMTLGNGITTKGTIKIFCCDSAPASSADSAKNVSLTVQSGEYDTLFMGSGTGSTYVGNIALALSNTADVRLLVLGGNKGHVGNLTIDISTSKLVDTIANTPNAATGEVGDVILNLNGCSVGEMRAYRSANDRTYYVKSFTVNVKAGTTLPSTFGVFSKMMLPDDHTTPISPVLNLESYKGTVSLSSFANINLTGDCEVTSASELTKQNITVGADSTLVLTYPTYTDVSALPADVVITASKGGTVTDAAYGKVYYKEITYPPVVFVDGTLTESGDGLTPETAVKTLTEAYALLSPIKGGKVVICGALTTAASTNLENVSGEVEITSVHEGIDYRETEGAVLTFPADNKVYIHFGDKTHVHDLSIVCTGTTVYMTTGADLLMGEGLSITQTEQLKLFCSDSAPASSADKAKNIKLTILSGDYESIWMGGLSASGYVGNVDYTQDGTASVRLLIMAGNKGFSGDITANMLGGTVAKLTTNGAKATNLTVGNVVVNLKGCAVKTLTAYGKNNTYGQSFTVNVYVDKIGLIPSQMGYYDQSYLPGTTTRIPLTLNYFNYNGSAVPVAGYDVVNIFGGGQIPEGYVSPAESGKSVLAIHGYTGMASIDLGAIDKLVATGNSDVTCAGVVPTDVVLSATDSKLRIRPSLQVSPWQTMSSPTTILFCGKSLLTPSTM